MDLYFIFFCYCYLVVVPVIYCIFLICWSLYTLNHHFGIILYLSVKRWYIRLHLLLLSSLRAIYHHTVIKLLMYESMLWILITHEVIKILNEKVTGNLLWIMVTEIGKKKNIGKWKSLAFILFFYDVVDVWYWQT